MVRKEGKGGNEVEREREGERGRDKETEGERGERGREREGGILESQWWREGGRK